MVTITKDQVDRAQMLLDKAELANEPDVKRDYLKQYYEHLSENMGFRYAGLAREVVVNQGLWGQGANSFMESIKGELNEEQRNEIRMDIARRTQEILIEKFDRGDCTEISWEEGKRIHKGLEHDNSWTLHLIEKTINSINRCRSATIDMRDVWNKALATYDSPEESALFLEYLVTAILAVSKDPIIEKDSDGAPGKWLYHAAYWDGIFHGITDFSNTNLSTQLEMVGVGVAGYLSTTRFRLTSISIRLFEKYVESESIPLSLISQTYKKINNFIKTGELFDINPDTIKYYTDFFKDHPKVIELRDRDLINAGKLSNGIKVHVDEQDKNAIIISQKILSTSDQYEDIYKVNKIHRILGSDYDDEIDFTDYQLSVHLLGGAGNDLLIGGSKDDILVGGMGNDTLIGGDGEDTYRVDSGDVIRDSNGRGRVYLDGKLLTGGYQVEGDNNVSTYRDINGNYYNLLGTTLVINDSLRIENFITGNLNLKPGDEYTYLGITLRVLSKNEVTLKEDDPNREKIIIDKQNGEDFCVPSNKNYYVIGGNGDDTLRGGDGHDALNGGKGDDILIGGSGDDLLIGGVGNDTLNGNTGNDVLVGGEGSNVLLGGNGNDLLYATEIIEVNADWGNNISFDTKNKGSLLSGSNGNDTFVGSSNNDLICAGAGNNMVYAGEGNDDIILYMNIISAGKNWDFELGGTAWFTTSVDSSTVNQVYAGAGNDSITGSRGGADIIYAGIGDDYIYGGFGNTLAYGEEGNDTIYGDGFLRVSDDRRSIYYGYLAEEKEVYGSDTLDGGAGDDSIVAGGGDDYLYGGAGSDTLFGDFWDATNLAARHYGDDYLDGGEGDDYLFAGNGDDTVYGGKGNDSINGDSMQTQNLSNKDYLDGGEGDDTIWGLFDDDTLVGGIGNDYLDGGEGNDSLQGDDGDDELHGQSGNDSLYGGNGDDSIYGEDGQDFIYGGAGNDSINGDAGNDSINGDDPSTLNTLSNSDYIDGGEGNDTMWGFAGADTLLGGDGDDYLDGGEGDDYLQGDAGNDILIGQQGNDTLSGGKGNDFLDGGDGDDVLAGGEGSDMLVTDAGNDSLYGGKGSDTYNILLANGSVVRLYEDFTDKEEHTDTVIINDTVYLDGTLGKVSFNNKNTKIYINYEGLVIETDNGKVILGNYEQFEKLSFAEGSITIQEIVNALHSSKRPHINNPPIAIGYLPDEQVQITSKWQWTLPNGSFIDYDSDDELTYQATLADGSTLPDWLKFDSKTATFRADVPEIVGLFNIIITAYDKAGASAQHHFNIELVPPYIEGTAANDLLLGTKFNDTIHVWGGMDTVLAGAGDDLIWGDGGDHFIDAGAGNDTIKRASAGTIIGGKGDDEIDISDGMLSQLHGATLIFNLGDGKDFVNSGWIDQLVFGEGITPDMVSIKPDMDETGFCRAIVIKIGDSDEIYLNFSMTHHDEVVTILKEIKFADGTIWNRSDMAKQLGTFYNLKSRFTGFQGSCWNDSIVGTNEDDVITDEVHAGPQGNYLDGGEGNDDIRGTGIIKGGKGNDFIEEASILSEVLDSIRRGLNAGSWQDLINKPEDYNSTFLFNLGDGQDIIFLEYMNTKDLQGKFANFKRNNKIIFGKDITSDMVTFKQIGDDLLIKVGDKGDQMLVRNYFSEIIEGVQGYQTITQFEFADGTKWFANGVLGIDPVTVISPDKPIIPNAIKGTEKNDRLTGDAKDNYLMGLAGNDLIAANAGNDTLDGGLGNDTLNGGTGNDTYLFAKGDGMDTINTGDKNQRLDTLRFTDITAEDIRSISRVGNNLVIEYGTNDKVTVVNHFNTMPVGHIAFGNEAAINFQDFLNNQWGGLVLTDKNDSFTVNNGQDQLIKAGLGNDRITTGAGNDTLYGEAGNDKLTGGAGDDILIGGLGNDSLNGGTGNDTYLFGRGDGQDTINNSSATWQSDNDRLLFQEGINADQLWFQKKGNNLIVSVIGTTDKITVTNWYKAEQYKLDSFELANGQALLANQVDNLVNAMACFNPPAQGQIELSSDYHNKLDSVIAVGWS